jgi:WhiB family transcriptional regulator, redox-sensing transcriptional regulator
MSHHTGAVPAAKRAADWRDIAACRTHDDPDLWFPIGASPAAQEQARQAQAICRTCPVLQACGMWSLKTRQNAGIWGGWTEQERRAFLCRRGIRLAQPRNTVDEPADVLAPRKGGRPRAECGTNSAYDRHVRLGEPIDEQCRAAHAAATARYRATGTRATA